MITKTAEGVFSKGYGMAKKQGLGAMGLGFGGLMVGTGMDSVGGTIAGTVVGEHAGNFAGKHFDSKLKAIQESKWAKNFVKKSPRITKALSFLPAPLRFIGTSAAMMAAMPIGAKIGNKVAPIWRRKMPISPGLPTGAGASVVHGAAISSTRGVRGTLGEAASKAV